MAVQYCNYDIKGTLAIAGATTLTGAATFGSSINMSDNQPINYGGQTMFTHTGSITRIGDNSSASVLSISGGNATFTGNVTATNILTVAGAATGSPFLQFTQGGTQKAYIQYVDSGDSFELQSDNQFVIRTGGSTTALTINSSRNATFAATSNALTVIARDNLFVGTGQLYIGAENSTTDNTFRQVVNTAAGGFRLQKRISGTFTDVLSFNNSNNATFAGSVTTTSIIGANTDFSIDVAGDINLDADGGDIKLKDGGVVFGEFSRSGSDFHIVANQQDGDMRFFGNDGGTSVNPLNFDMSAGGLATFLATPVVGTRSAGDNTTRAASTAFVTTAVASAGSGTFLPLAGGTMSGDITLSTDADILKAGTNPFRVFTNGTEALSISASQNATFAGSLMTVPATIEMGGNWIIQGTDGSYFQRIKTIDSSGADAETFSFDVKLGSAASYKQLLVLNQNDSIGGTFLGNLTVSGGNITLGGTGRIQGVDTVSASTDAANKAYVDAHVSPAGTYLPLAGGTMTGNIDFNDNVRARFGNGDDLQIVFDGNNSFIHNVDNGDLYLRQQATDKDIILECDDGSGGLDDYIRLDGSAENVKISKDTVRGDNVKASWGDANDLQIYHDGSNSYIVDTGTGTLNLRGSTQVLISGANGEIGVQYVENAGVGLRHNNVQKLATESTGITVTGNGTFSGDLTVTGGDITLGGTGRITGVDTVSAGTDAANKTYVDAQISSIPSGLNFQGNWNADTNSPTLASGTGTPGFYYNVSVAGNTNLDGETDWEIGDWAVFVENGTNDFWEKIDNTSALTGVGANNQLSLWGGTNTLEGSSALTFSGGNLNVTGDGNSAQWFEAYNNQVTAISDSGSSTITLTLTQEDGGTLTTSFSNPQGTVTGTGTNDALPMFNSAGTGIEDSPFAMGNVDQSISNTDLIIKSKIGHHGNLKTAFGFINTDTFIVQLNNVPYLNMTTSRFRITDLPLRIGNTVGIELYNFNSANLVTLSEENGNFAISTIPNATSDTDKFLVSDSGEVKYRTGAQVLSDIGGAPATGGAYLPLTGGTLTGGLTGTTASFNAGTSNVVATFTSTDGIAGIALVDNSGNVELSASGDTFQVQPAGGTAALTVSSTSATFAGNVGVAGKTPAYGLNLAQGTGAGNKIAWTDGTPNFRASIWANSSDDKFKIATGNASSVETVALEIDTSQNATFAGNVTTSGSLISSNIIINQITSGTVNGNINIRNNAGSNIAVFNNDLSTTFAGSAIFTNGAAFASAASIRQQSDILILTGGGNGFAFNDDTNAVSNLLINAGGEATFSSSGTFGGNVSTIANLNGTNEVRVTNSNSGNIATARFIAISDSGNIQLKAVSSTNTTYGSGDEGVLNCDTMSNGFKIAHNDIVKYTLSFAGENTWTGGGTFGGDVVVNNSLSFSTNGFADFGNIGTGAMRFKPSGNTLALTLTGANATFAGDITVTGGDISLSGTGRIQGIDTVSDGTDAANKDYVDTAVAGSGSGSVTSVSSSTTTLLTVSESSPAPALSIVTAAVTNGGTALATGDQIYDATSARLTSYLNLAGGTMVGNINMGTNRIIFGSNHLKIYNDGTDSYLENVSGDMYIMQRADNADMSFQNDNGAGGDAEYFRLDGGSELTFFSKAIQTADNAKIFVGNAGDLSIYHDGTHSFVKNTTGSLYVLDDSYVEIGNGAEISAGFLINGAVNLYYDNSKKFETSNTGVTVTGKTTSTDDLILSQVGPRIDFDNGSAGSLRLFSVSQGAAAMTLTSAGNATFAGDILLSASSSIVLDDTPTASTASGSGTIVNWSVSVSVSAGTLYVIKSDGGWTTADADSEAKSTAMAAIALGSNATAGMLLQGFFYKSNHGFAIGSPLYISNTAGAFSNSRPTGTGDYVRIIGYATSTNYIYFDPDKTWVKID